jgi:hypothetical protein
MTAFPVAGGLMKEIDHPKPDKTSARRGITRHAKHFKDGGMSDADFEQKIKETHTKLSGY